MNPIKTNIVLALITLSFFNSTSIGSEIENTSEPINVDIIQVEIIEQEPVEDEYENTPPLAKFDYTKTSRIIERLRELAEMHNCIPVWDLVRVDIRFYGPWHLDISALTGNQGDFIFSCKSKDDKYVFKVIVAAKLGRNIWVGCPSEAYAGSTIPYPLGLSILDSKSSYYPSRDLSNWHTEEGQQGPTGKLPYGPVIDTATHDSGVVLTCHEGKWYGYLSH